MLRRRPGSTTLRRARSTLRARPWIADTALASVLVMAGLVQLTVDGMTLIGVLGMLAMTTPVAWRRVAPLIAVTVGWAALFLEQGFGGDVTSQGYGAVIALILTLYTAATRLERSRAYAALVIALVSDWLSVALSAAPTVADFAFTTLIVVAPWGAGRVIRDRHQRIDELHALSAALEHEREERVREAAIAERERMGREMHDVLTHTVSVMVVQLGAVTRILERDPATARATIESVRNTGKEALAELRFLLGLGARAAHPDSEVPNPGLARIGELAEAMRRSGLPVELRLEIPDGGLERLPQPIDLAAYRIVQESLTNTLRHSPGASALVRIGMDGSRLDVLIADSGGQPRRPLALGRELGTEVGGHGITGMRERARLCDGELTAGTEPAGGFTVRALLPAEVTP
ncbi:histidine kinase [Salinibacterium sp. ZJ454]|uniref:sensor histidine kinase n=1 Tax=Salinibacterium sp. ZJ454 TaxID=2708339 RepID=UPI0014232C83|nr:histidine kinase [Salinibacterium sp. ZJ454]